MNIKWKSSLVGGLALVLMSGAAAYAFSDTAGNSAQAQIEALWQAGVISGVSDDKFAPEESVTTAAAVRMIVKGLKLNIDKLKFVKEPKASDSFTKVADDAWYAQAFVIAKLNGLPLDTDIDPNSPVTREKFVQLLQAAVNTKGEFPQILMFVQLADEDQVSKEMMNAVQWSIIGNIVRLDSEKSFRPKAETTRAEVASMVYNAIQFVESHTQPPAQPSSTVPKQVASLSVDKVNDQINQATVSWGQQPNPGYRITIDRIDFKDNHEAVLTYSLHYPEPGKMYPQHVVQAKVSVFLAAEWKPILQQAAGQSTPSVPPQAASDAHGTN